MNNPNPFVPQGSLLEQHKRRSRMKLAVFCTVAVSVCGLTAMLIQGCKREQAPETSADMSSTSMLDTNPPVVMGSNNPVVTPVPVMPVTPEPAAGETYVVVKGDTLGHIATSHHVSLKALMAANPNIQPTRLKVGDKLTIPASTGGATTSPMDVTAGSGEEIYTVKSGDSLTKIAKDHGTTIKAIQTANNLSTTSIKVGQKLKIPTKAEAPTTTVNAPPMPVAPTPAPSTPPTGQ